MKRNIKGNKGRNKNVKEVRQNCPTEKRKDADKIAQQIQRGFEIAKKWMSTDKNIKLKHASERELPQPSNISIDYHDDSDGCYYCDTQLIIINPTICLNASKIYGIELIEYIARVINHEFLHHILHIDHGREATRGLDIIIGYSSDMEKWKEVWMW